MVSVMWAAQHVERVNENGTRPPATLDGCLADSFWAWMLQDYAKYAEEQEGNNSIRRGLELLTWFWWWDGLGDTTSEDAAQLRAAIHLNGAGYATDATAISAIEAAADGTGDAGGLAGPVATLRQELDAELAAVYDDFRQTALAAETFGTNRWGDDGVLSDKEADLSGVLEVRNQETGEFENELQHREITDDDFEAIAAINGANVKNLDDGESTDVLISGFFVMIGSGHGYNEWWANERERTNIEAAARGTVTVRKGGLRGAGKLKFSGIEPHYESLVVDAVSRFSDKEVELT